MQKAKKKNRDHWEDACKDDVVKVIRPIRRKKMEAVLVTIRGELRGQEYEIVRLYIRSKEQSEQFLRFGFQIL